MANLGGSVGNDWAVKYEILIARQQHDTHGAANPVHFEMEIACPIPVMADVLPPT
ncbi:hypothetical protein RSSM_02292 [Rhodopirellula sallentina SM41]|uniref:Uncharacterized protein n=1 Tax=Rhodopirellula sallentina SM41 TaxID=1263870 RepID=M5UJT9_9BACT|nr:hypothetical protein RSSM_02292 [Rhodopirellula sallentina SM41]